MALANQHPVLVDHEFDRLFQFFRTFWSPSKTSPEAPSFQHLTSPAESTLVDHPSRSDAVLASIRMEAELQQLQGSASGVHGFSTAIHAPRQPEILDQSGLQTDSAKALAVSGPSTSLQALSMQLPLLVACFTSETKG